MRTVTLYAPSKTFNLAGLVGSYHIIYNKLLQAGWDVGVVWRDGRAFHGQNHIRMNLALPLSRVKEAFQRLDQYVFRA